jgi:hypothetical protein
MTKGLVYHYIYVYSQALYKCCQPRANGNEPNQALKRSLQNMKDLSYLQSHRQAPKLNDSLCHVYSSCIISSMRFCFSRGSYNLVEVSLVQYSKEN